MAINFPDSPNNGDTYTATNGAVYVYNATIDNWTGLDVWLRDSGGNVYTSNASANVGIGINSPAYSLHVSNDTSPAIVSQKGDVVLSSLADTSAAYIGTTSNHPLYIQSNDNDVITVATSGNVGIGEPNPSTDLHVASSNTSPVLIESSTTDSLIQYKNSDTDVFYAGASDTNWNVQSSGAQRLSVTTDGKVGINNSIPQSELDVDGNIFVGDPDITDGQATGVEINSGGKVTVKKATNTSDSGFSVVDGTTEVIHLDGDGSATFTGAISASDYTLTDGTVVDGTVMEVTAGTGIVTSPPEGITETGSINLANTAVTPGQYFNATVTVDQQGRITQAIGGTEIVIFGGPVDVTQTCPASIQNIGEFVINIVRGNADSSWTGIAGVIVEPNQFVFFTKNSEWALGAIGEVDQFVTLGTDQLVSGAKTFSSTVGVGPDVGNKNITLDPTGNADFKGQVGIGDFTNVSGGISYDLQIESNGGKGLLVNAHTTQDTDTNKALHVTNGLSGDTFNVSYRGVGYFEDSLGVGTQTPVQKLSVVGNNEGISLASTGSEANYYHLYRNSTNGFLTFDGVQQSVSGYNFRVTKDGASSAESAIYVENSGAVGIGSTDPSAILEVVSPNPTVAVFKNKGSSNETRLQLQNLNSGKNDVFVTNNNGNFNVLTDSGSAKLTVIESGLVGIGTYQPASLLQLQAADALSLQLERTGDSASTCLVSNEGNLLALKNNTNGVAFFTGVTPTQVMTIDASGDVGIGTIDPQTELEVVGTITADNFIKSDGTPISGGDVSSVNNVDPDSSGNVELTAANVGAVATTEVSTSVTSTSVTDVAASIAVKNAYDRAEEYAPSQTGENASGVWAIAVSGNSATATTANAVNLEGLDALP